MISDYWTVPVVAYLVRAMPEEPELVAQVNVRVTAPMLADLNELRGRWIPAALLARKAMEIGLEHLKANRHEVAALEPRPTGPKPKADSSKKTKTAKKKTD